MTIKEQISADIKDAMRSQNKEKLNALRLISAAIKQIEVDERIEVDDTRMLSILDKLAKQRNESITQFRDAGRDELAEKELFELNIIRHYLPAPLAENEVEELVNQTISKLHAQSMADMGKVMAAIKASVQGRADMAKVSNMIKAKLAK